MLQKEPHVGVEAREELCYLAAYKKKMLYFQILKHI